MTRYGLAALLMTLACLTTAVSAQTPTPEPAPWPPDPNAIFAEGVAWRATEEQEENLIKVEEQSGISVEYDQDRHLIRVINLEQNTRREYAYPDEMLVLTEISKQNNGLIHAIFSDYGPVLLDPETGGYQRLPTVCEGRVEQAEAGQGQWQIVKRSNGYGQEENSFLCQTETDEQHDNLPPELTDWRIFPTPDETQLMLVATSGYEYQIFIYNLIDGSLVAFGPAGNAYDDNLLVCDWITETKGLLCGTNRDYDYLPTNYYEFDITQPDSLNLAFYAWPTTLLTLENPKRYFVMYVTEYSHRMFGGWSGNEPFQPCTLLVYDATGSREHVLGNTCILLLDYFARNTPRYSGIPFYYLITDDPYNSIISSLYRYDIQHEMASEPLFTGEIESIVSASSDERYVVLLLDDNGVLDFPWEDDWCRMGAWQVAILDTKTGDIVYRSEPIGVYTAGQVVWLDNQTLVIAASAAIRNFAASHENIETVTQEIPATLRRIHIGGKSVTEDITTNYEFDTYFYPFSVQSHYSLSNQNILVDLNTFERLPLLNEGIPEQYHISTQWNQKDPQTLKVSISLLNNISVTGPISYLLTLPD